MRDKRLRDVKIRHVVIFFTHKDNHLQFISKIHRITSHLIFEAVAKVS